MHRFYLPPDRTKDSTLILTDGEAHHAAQVLRLQTGDRVVVLNGAGHEFSCEVSTVAKKSVSLAVVERKFTDPQPCSITLLQAIPKGKMMEWIIEKATEMGAVRVVPLLTDRVVVHLDTQGRQEKRDKWQQVAIEAIKQCGQDWLPEIAMPVSLKSFLAQGEKFELPLVGSLQSGSRHPRRFFDDFRSKQNRNPKSIAIFIGPEGDFTPEEIALITQAGANPITLGQLVLRCETAAMYCMALSNYELNSETNAAS